MNSNKERGFGLVEIIVAAAVIGGLALVVMRFTQNATKVTNNVEANNDILTTVQQIQGILSDPESCTATLVGRRANNAINVVQALRLKNNGVFIDAFQTKALNPSISFGQKLLKINSYSLSDAAEDVDVTTLGTTHFLVDFDRGTKGSQTTAITKKIYLRVVVNASGDIVSCSAFNSAASELWKYSNNNTDIFYSGGNVGIGTMVPTANLTVRATTFPLQPGIAIIGNEGGMPGWHRANIGFDDQTSTHSWYMAIFGASSFEGEGSFGINGGPKGTPAPNKMLLTKDGDVGIGTQSPYCGFVGCPSSIDLHIHNKTSNQLDGAAVILSSDATANSSLVGAIAFGTMSSPSADKRVAVITGQINEFSPFRGNLVFWTANNGVNTFNMVLGPTGDLWLRRELEITNLIETSDRRLKKDIKPIKDSLAKLGKIDGVTFNWKDSRKSKKQLGLIAQDVEEIYPEIVKNNIDGMKSIAYLDLIAPVINAIQDLNKYFTKRQSELNQIEKDTILMKHYLCQHGRKENFCTTGAE